MKKKAERNESNIRKKWNIEKTKERNKKENTKKETKETKETK